MHTAAVKQMGAPTVIITVVKQKGTPRRSSRLSNRQEPNSSHHGCQTKWIPAAITTAVKQKGTPQRSSWLAIKQKRTLYSHHGCQTDRNPRAIITAAKQKGTPHAHHGCETGSKPSIETPQSSLRL